MILRFPNVFYHVYNHAIHTALWSPTYKMFRFFALYIDRLHACLDCSLDHITSARYHTTIIYIGYLTITTY